MAQSSEQWTICKSIHPILISRVVLILQVISISSSESNIEKTDIAEYTTTSGFSVVSEGRLFDDILMHVEDIGLQECMSKCAQHEMCRTVNYHEGRRICELVDNHFADVSDSVFKGDGWLNYGTPTKGICLKIYQ